MTLKRRIRSILLITPFFSPNIGGVETHLRDLCDYLGKEGDNISVVTYQPLVTRVRASSKEDRRGLMIRRISWFGHGLFDRLEPYPFLELAYLLPGLFFWTLIFILSHKRRVDVIYTHGLVASLVGRLIKPILRRPMVATIHTIYYLGSKPTLGRILTWILKPYDKVLFVSERIREEFVGSGLDAGKTAVFTYWADQSRFKPMDKQRARKMLHW